ncbi:unnamed protein product [Effrenium voratum]|uniref:Uncharacterized protein n=1 Tax=Effrenium voratum TaxID=2562239 RepID=A0AA36MV10_9DINO|nr:unnamed protein product [Effrenium voratum]
MSASLTLLDTRPDANDRQHFTLAGFEAHNANRAPDLRTFRAPMGGRICLMTGTDSVCRELARFLLECGATLYVVCRSQSVADELVHQLSFATRDQACPEVQVLLGDLSLKAEMMRCWREFQAKEPQKRLDVLVCGEQRFCPAKRLTAEGFEETFAANLLVGTYMLCPSGHLAMPLLQATPNSRAVLVSSWEMPLGSKGFGELQVVLKEKAKMMHR